MLLPAKQSRQDPEKKIRDLENEIKRLKKDEQATRNSLKTAQSELQRSSDRLRKTMGGIIQAMSLTIEKRDPYTAGHQRRVTKLCRVIATIIGFSWERIQGFRMAAAIHDLGKIRVPAEILSKPGRLTENEFGIIKTHPQIGFDILKGIEFSWPIAQIVLQHHERMDGSGYPQGLSGEDILPEARILAVADVVEAMSSHRPYRPALGLEKATAEIRQQSGILYDADVVDACLKALAENKTLLQQTSHPE
jgi:HD-GYP domain-containing protein (c-di-GMP phosphodiesterase class II)